jgi:hypothetical protein
VNDGLNRADFADAGDSWTLVRDTANQSDAVIASLRMVDDTIVGSVNSAERAEEVVELLAEHVPDAQHVNTEVLDLDDVDEADRPAPNDQAEMLANPEIRAAMEAHMANYEAEWLDNPVPALKGLTPRDAAAGPIAREELIRLWRHSPRWTRATSA